MSRNGICNKTCNVTQHPAEGIVEGIQVVLSKTQCKSGTKHKDLITLGLKLSEIKYICSLVKMYAFLVKFKICATSIEPKKHQQKLDVCDVELSTDKTCWDADGEQQRLPLVHRRKQPVQRSQLALQLRGGKGRPSPACVDGGQARHMGGAYCWPLLYWDPLLSACPGASAQQPNSPGRNPCGGSAGTPRHGGSG